MQKSEEIRGADGTAFTQNCINIKSTIIIPIFTEYSDIPVENSG